MPERRRRVWILLWLAVLGAAGTLCRYWLDGWLQDLCGSRFPWGILVVNLLGCFAFGFVYPLAEERWFITGQSRQIILTGFMGAFTTFSTFTYQTTDFLEKGQWFDAFANVAVQVVCGIGLMFVGLALGRML
jgi:fluoride exporter